MTPRTVKFRIKKEDFDAAEPGDCYRCLVTHALNRELGIPRMTKACNPTAWIKVLRQVVYIYDRTEGKDFIRLRADTTVAVKDVITLFDIGKHDKINLDRELELDFQITSHQ